MQQTAERRADKNKTKHEPWRDPHAEAYIRIENITKRFGDFVAVNNVSLKIYKGEIFCLLGGSGCGKSTLLRMLAGFETPSSGAIYLDGQDMAGVPPYERPVNMMFQSYALFPHMTVEKNIAFGLEQEKGLSRSDIATRVTDILEIVKLTQFAARKPHQLSGGQRQRVALARSLVKRPKLLLLDEPLAALDKKLREHTQFELANLQYQLGTTFVVVTHDQDEAMVLASRIGVMAEGRIVQVGTPGEVYEFPANRHVASFVGNINVIEGKVTRCGGGRVAVRSEPLNAELSAPCADALADGTTLTLAVRPEKITISRAPPAGNDHNVLKGTVRDLGYFGDQSLYRVKLAAGTILQVSAQNLKRTARLTVEWDDEVYLSWEVASTILLRA